MTHDEFLNDSPPVAIYTSAYDLALRQLSGGLPDGSAALLVQLRPTSGVDDG